MHGDYFYEFALTLRNYQYILFYIQNRRRISADARELAIAQGTAMPHQKRFSSAIGQYVSTVRKCSPKALNTWGAVTATTNVVWFQGIGRLQTNFRAIAQYRIKIRWYRRH